MMWRNDLRDVTGKRLERTSTSLDLAGEFVERSGAAEGGVLVDVHDEDGQLDAAAHSYFFKDAEEVVFYGVLADVEATRDLAVALAGGDECGDVELAPSEVESGAGGDMEGGGLGEGVQNEPEFARADPDLSLVNGVDALEKVLDRFGAKEDAAGMGAEGVHDEVHIHFIEQNDNRASRNHALENGQGLEPSERAV